MTDPEPRVYGVAFWLVSAVRGVGALFFGTVIALWCIFSITVIRSDGFSVHAIVGTFPPALFWSLAGIALTCLVSVPTATLVAGIIRIAYGRRTRRAVVVEDGEAVD
ncbi:hypothetical protein [Williamsia herbipolensis]|uniref:hypothetical protein n=1 Tax=Williamsia herbipolensis TaxID=1603258 RepID=UPI0005F7BF02|nr:hypothetical protein [Williamsia herbipolensis]